jgi:hypothetical protein
MVWANDLDIQHVAFDFFSDYGAKGIEDLDS